MRTDNRIVYALREAQAASRRGISADAWAEAVRKADTDRATVKRLVSAGSLRRVGQPLPPRVNLAIRPKSKRRRK